MRADDMRAYACGMGCEHVHVGCDGRMCVRMKSSCDEHGVSYGHKYMCHFCLWYHRCRQCVMAVYSYTPAGRCAATYRGCVCHCVCTVEDYKTIPLVIRVAYHLGNMDPVAHVLIKRGVGRCSVSMQVWIPASARACAVHSTHTRQFSAKSKQQLRDESLPTSLTRVKAIRQLLTIFTESRGSSNSIIS